MNIQPTMQSYLTRAADFALTLVDWVLFVLAFLLLLTQDVSLAADTPKRVESFTRGIEFDFVNWTFDATWFKILQASVGDQAYLDDAARSKRVRDYFDLQAKLEQVQGSIAVIYANPEVKDPEVETAPLQAEEANLRARMRELQPLAEAILQEQVSVILAKEGLVVGGQPLPPVAFHFTPLPLALIVSPRSEIKQDVNVDVNGNLTLEEQVALEDRVARELDVSTLIVPLGGIGTYPTMVASSSDLNWIANVTAHEWTHNYLTLRPLGFNYSSAPELRTMNETTASIAGNELGALVIQRYYPERQPPPPAFQNILRREQPSPGQTHAPGFNFGAEMHTTRVRVDGLLAANKVSEAEAYMEERRQFFWDQGYQIRKLNQAYFAFYGAYAEGGGGAPGEDPVGPAVLLVRRRSPTIKVFLDTMAGFSTFEQLKQYLAAGNFR
jgi:hypothetical protein